VQFGATLSKHVFPLVGSEGATALRQFFATALLLIDTNIRVYSCPFVVSNIKRLR
jgi:threonine/homoserine efflux transporter RhtA